MTSRDDDALAPPTHDELDHSPWQPPYTGPRADHVYLWTCSCGIPASAHPTTAELEAS